MDSFYSLLYKHIRIKLLVAERSHATQKQTSVFPVAEILPTVSGEGKAERGAISWSFLKKNVRVRGSPHRLRGVGLVSIQGCSWHFICWLLM